MKRVFCICVVIVFCLGLLIGCGGKSRTAGSDASISRPVSLNEKLIWSTGERPGWTINEPRSEGDNLYFVGLSGNYVEERNAREDVRRDAANQVVNYYGVAVKDQFQQITTRFGLSSDISDPTIAGRNFTEQFAAGVSRQLKVEQWYIEQWQTKVGETYFKAYGLASVPKSVAEQSFNDVIDAEQAKLRDKAKQERNQQAKKQMEDAINAFESMKNSGFIK
jgi:hypothetical protein